MMASLSAAERAKLPDRAFAYVDSSGKRRLPIHDEAHVRNALARFERVSFESDAARERARRRLLQAAKRYGIVPVGFIDGQIRKERRSHAPDATAFPTGTVTFLMTDIEGSTTLVHRLGTDYTPLLREARSIVRNATRRSGGVLVDAHADETLSVFASPASALEAAIDLQRRMRAAAWPEGVRLRVRAGLHRGRPTLTDAGYIGVAVNTVSRVCFVGHGGQIVVSERARAALLPVLPSGVSLSSLGRHHLAGLPGTLPLYQVETEGLRRRFPALRVAALERR
jgi:class 3 adenylate cyclase